MVSDTQVLVMRRGGSICVVGVHVDDVTLACNDEELRTEVMAHLDKHFMVKDLGDLSHYLGMRVTSHEAFMEIGQDAYIMKMLAKFRMALAAKVDTPGVAGQVFSKQDCPQDDEEKTREWLSFPIVSWWGP